MQTLSQSDIDLYERKLPKFEEFVKTWADYLILVRGILGTKLEDDPVAMDFQAREIEQHKVKVGKLLAFAEEYLDQAEYSALKGIGQRQKDKTDLDRETQLNSVCGFERRFRNEVLNISKTIQERVSYAQTRLRVFASADGNKLVA